jgi:hypothetical protein
MCGDHDPFARPIIFLIASVACPAPPEWLIECMSILRHHNLAASFTVFVETDLAAPRVAIGAQVGVVRDIHLGALISLLTVPTFAQPIIAP